MNTRPDSALMRRTLYALLITLAAGSVGGRILSVARLYEPHLFRDEADPSDQRSLWPRTRPEPMPTHGDNDRSRWDTVRALVDDGTYVIGQRDRQVAVASGLSMLGASNAAQAAVLGEVGYQVRVKSDRGIMTEDGWRTIDKVMNPDTLKFYSSKPPLLANLVAGEYWLLKKTLGWSIVAQRWEVVRVILLTTNWLPFIIYLWLLSRLLERFGETDWGRLYVLAAGGFGTLLTPFAITLNNHSLATCSALFALYPALEIWDGRARRPGLFVAAGFFAGFTAANELPALVLVGALLLMLLWRAPIRTLFFFVPAVAIPAAAFLWTNYQAVGHWTPVYAEFGGPWYEYEGSYWKIEPGQVKHGIDWAYQAESKAGYAFHVLLGHHGLFSLTPIYLFAAAGMIFGLRPRQQQAKAVPQAGLDELLDKKERPSLQMAAPLSLLLTVIVIAFYIFFVNDRNRNYGGWTSGLRWLMWLTPFWLLSMLPVADWLSSRRWGRGLAYIFLAISVLSASYPAWNPWRNPWLYNFLEAHGWIGY